MGIHGHGQLSSSAGGSAAVGFLRLSAREDPAPALSGRRPVAAALPMLLGPTGEGVALCLPFAACAADMALAADRGACVGVRPGLGAGAAARRTARRAAWRAASLPAAPTLAQAHPLRVQSVAMYCEHERGNTFSQQCRNKT